MFITFEANEGAGKTTQSRRLVEALRALGYDVVHTREPGGSPGAEEIRRLVIEGDPGRWSATTELLLFTAARRDHIERLISPALASGSIVVCDRYLGSTHALQGAGGMNAEKIDLLFETFCAVRPDMTVYLDIDPAISLARGEIRLAKEDSAEGRFERKGSAFHARVSEIFYDQYTENPEWVRYDAARDIETIAGEILRDVLAHPALPARQRVQVA